VGTLKNWKHERFACQIAEGTNPADAYVIAGFQRNRANHFRLMRQPRVAARIAELKRDREAAARAARVPIDQVLAELNKRGLDGVADFFERNAAGILSVRDLQGVPVEVSIALLKLLREGFGINAAS
jgi:phage terminase small subunit